MSHTIEQRIETFTETLIERFGFKKKEAKTIAVEAMTNLDRHVNLQEVMIKRVMEKRKK
jgi:hypothetical protein